MAWEKVGKIENIVFAGMGGSALAASLSTTWPGYDVPFEICRGYTPPAYISDSTLFIASSYSGNTEETLSALLAAEQLTQQIAVITSGGKLAEIAREKGYALVELPAGLQPRFATLYSYKALMTLLDACGVTQKSAAELAAQADFLRDVSAGWRPDIASKDNLAKQIALDSVGRSMVIYSGGLLFPAAYKWKISFNENAKNVE